MIINSIFTISIHFHSFYYYCFQVLYWFCQFVPLRVISLCASIIGSSCRCFIWVSFVGDYSFICRWLLLHSVGDWLVILNWRLMVMLIHSFLNTSTRLISVLQSLVHHVGASFGGFFRWWLIHSFVGDWRYNLLVIGLSYWSGDWWWCSSTASSTPLLD